MSTAPPRHPATAGFDFSHKKPDGDEKERLVCNGCGFVNYVNPKIVVGAVTEWEGKILMCRRAIDPRKGYWTLPAGFMEEGETTEEGAMREAREEANADLEILSLLAVYNIPRISQVQLMYKARLLSKNVSAGPESLEVTFFDWEDIPWGEIAFPSVVWALNHYRQVRDVPVFSPFVNPEGENGNFLPAS
ncbi:MAG: NUDIX domain-containing protein [Alphaproteobacteria bacterium]|nr:NUDIX domain-containing protein [Alphaproteobacteria bacterium]